MREGRRFSSSRREKVCRVAVEEEHEGISIKFTSPYSRTWVEFYAEPLCKLCRVRPVLGRKGAFSHAGRIVGRRMFVILDLDCCLHSINASRVLQLKPLVRF